jgi:hypothetical protein
MKTILACVDGSPGQDWGRGTTAAKVVHHSDRTVLVVRAPERLA